MIATGRRPCPICGAGPAEATLFLDEKIDLSKMSAFSFSSRKRPEFMNHRLVRCRRCDLAYADAPPDQATLAEAYRTADYDSSEEASDAADSYVEAMTPVLAQLASRRSVMEIGAGTGVLLERLRPFGFTELIGVEPSAAAIAAAPPERRPWLRQDIFREENFVPASFDLICCFMTLEHVRDPLTTVVSARKLLRPGGALITVTHDYRSAVNRLLGRKSPIIDIEHMQLFSQRSLRTMLMNGGYSEIFVMPFRNRYSVRYWARLAPLPKGAKMVVERLGGRLARMKLAVNVGNTIAGGFRQESV